MLNSYRLIAKKDPYFIILIIRKINQGFIYLKENVKNALVLLSDLSKSDEVRTALKIAPSLENSECLANEFCDLRLILSTYSFPDGPSLSFFTKNIIILKTLIF